MKKRVSEKDKNIFHERKLTLKWWINKSKRGKSFIHKIQSETWHGSHESFVMGYIFGIIFGNNIFCFRIMWWQHKLF